MRERKQRKLYSDEWALGDDDAEGGRGFSLADKLESARFEQPGAVLEMHGADLTVGYLQRHGFTTPILFKEKTGLGLRTEIETTLLCRPTPPAPPGARSRGVKRPALARPRHLHFHMLKSTLKPWFSARDRMEYDLMIVV
ncbi:JmjC domain-containing histone demethylation protein 1 [Eumeta japonica]|uniref:JmjC domain-containing histone demethylation protein 1 n=1 Tax=Eumeta variegata TaxID=151549 RepID=A0A4C1XPC3_EUMVA|nr:JmjC domain-containing histone demethylation protein 1 [Eumeta japonica]